MAVLAIVLVIAVPELGGFIRTSKVRAAQSELISALMLARSEAGKHGLPAILQADASVAGNTFGGGWTVWIDNNRSGDVDAGDEPVRRYPGFGASVLLTAGTTTFVKFNANGFVAGANAVNFKVCGAGSSNKGFAVQLQPAGFADLGDQATCP